MPAGMSGQSGGDGQETSGGRAAPPILAAFRSANDADRYGEDTLLEQFYLTLRATAASARAENSAFDATMAAAIDELLSRQPRSWPTAYEIEQLLCLVLSDAQLDTELPRRLEEAKQLKLTYVPVLQSQFDSLAEKGERSKRVVLQRVLNDLQWFYTQRIRRRVEAERYAHRVSSLFWFAFAVFLTALILQYAAAPDSVDTDGRPASPAAAPEATSGDGDGQ